MTIADEVEALSRKLAELEEGPSVIGDWHRLEARAARALIHVQNQALALQRELLELVRAEPPDPQWYGCQARAHALRDQCEELRMVQMSAQCRVFEHEAEVYQRT